MPENPRQKPVFDPFSNDVFGGFLGNTSAPPKMPGISPQMNFTGGIDPLPPFLTGKNRQRLRERNPFPQISFGGGPGKRPGALFNEPSQGSPEELGSSAEFFQRLMQALLGGSTV